ncbi:hypothetical protein [Salipaludibacillus keqinensis]|nr:hypothetical protein [Salipaludibacillus keqinensis]
MRIDQLTQLMEDIKGRGTEQASEETGEMMSYIETRLREVMMMKDGEE